MDLRYDWWRWLVTIIACFFALLLLYGCKSTQFVPGETIIRDTTSYAHWDSLVNERVRVIRDSLMAFHWEQTEKITKDSTFVKDDVRTRVDDKGNVIGRDSIHIEIRYRDSKELSNVRDSLACYRSLTNSVSVYKAKADSLNHLLLRSKDNVKYIEKDLGGLDLFYYNVGKWLTWMLGISLIAMIVVLFIKSKIHNFFRF